MEKSREPSPSRRAAETEAEEAGAQVEVSGSPTRCPFCHAGCRPEEASAVVCSRCLSRHHAGCWGEAGRRCASCGSTRGLVGERQPVEVAPRERALLARGLPEEAAAQLARRAGLSEDEARRALLEEAGRLLQMRRFQMSGGQLIALVAITLAFLIPILAILRK